MKAVTFVNVSLLLQIGLCFYIPIYARPSVELALHTRDTRTADVEVTNSMLSPTLDVQTNPKSWCSKDSLRKREPSPHIFDMGRTKGYYEVHGEKATDRLYDIKEGTVPGSDILEKKGDDLMRQISDVIYGPGSDVNGVSVTSIEIQAEG